MSSRVRTRAAATAGAALAALLAVAPAAPAAAQADVFVEVNPSTIQAGYRVEVRASCGEGLNPASVTSDAFGELRLRPRPVSRRMVGSVTVPSTTPAGRYQVDLHCATGATGQAELFVLDMAQPTRGPKTGGGGTHQAGAPDAGAGPVGPVLLAGAGAVALAAGAGLLVGRRRRAG